MLHIQKHSRFFAIEHEDGAVASVKKKVDLRTPVELKATNEAYTKEKEAILWYTQKGLTSMVDDIQKALITAGYDLGPKGADGKLGPATIQAIMKFQRDHGIDDDGKAGTKTMAKLGIAANDNIVAAKREKVSPDEAEASVNKKEKNWFEKLFDADNNDELRAELDKYIGAGTTPELKPLGHEAGEAKISGDAKYIASVYKKILAVLKDYVTDKNVYKAFTGAKSQEDQEDVLDFFEGALMGSGATEKVAKGRLGAENYTANSDAVLKHAKEVLASYSFAGQTISRVKGLRKYMKGNLDSIPLDKGIYFSVRTQDGTRRLSPFTKAQEALTLGGANLWEVPETQADIEKLIMNMSEGQLKLISKKVSLFGSYNKAELIEAVRAGRIKFNVQMFLAENCSNISFRLVPTVVNFHNGNGGNGGGNGGSDNDRPSSDPGDRGGGDEGGGGDDGDQGSDRDA